MIRCVISDLGKVILFFDNDIFFKKIAEYSPFSKEEIAALTSAHFKLVEYFDKGKMTPEEFYRRVTKTFKAKIDYENFYSIYNEVFSPNPPVLELMKKLKRNYRMLLLSNTDVMRFGFIKKKFPEILIFDEYILSYEVGLMKPDLRIYQKALKKAGAEARECVFIDDINKNVEAAIKLGIHGIQMQPETDLEAVLQDMGLSF
jgi:epoxide hydrolase-like predicted phosphatase